MERNELNSEIRKILSHFNNAEELMMTSQLFNTVVNYLARGSDPYLMIGELITMVEKNQEAYKDLVAKTPTRYIVADKETIERLKASNP